MNVNAEYYALAAVSDLCLISFNMTFIYRNDNKRESFILTLLSASMIYYNSIFMIRVPASDVGV